ncbi:MAG: DNA polymerase III subunit delta' [Dehalococcoidia bacterium]
MAFLRGSLKGGRLAHAYLFVGPPQVGKKTTALNFAQALNCPEAEPPCGECRPCQRIASGKHADVRVVGLLPDERTGRLRIEIGIDQIRDMEKATYLPPYEGKYKVFIIDGAERLSQEASNCLLKTLEEPPPPVVFILLASNETALLPTVISRCQKVEFPPMSAAAVEAALVEHWAVEPKQAGLLARLSAGRLGWALAMKEDEQLLHQRQEKLAGLIELAAADQEKRFAHAAHLVSQFEQDREATFGALHLWLEWWRDLMLANGGCGEWATNIDRKDLLAHQAQSYTLAQTKGAMTSIVAVLDQLRHNVNPRLALEVLMLDLPRAQGR